MIDSMDSKKEEMSELSVIHLLTTTLTCQINLNRTPNSSKKLRNYWAQMQ